LLDCLSSEMDEMRWDGMGWSGRLVRRVLIARRQAQCLWVMWSEKAGERDRRLAGPGLLGRFLLGCWLRSPSLASVPSSSRWRGERPRGGGGESG
jgi:hypothetical protein